MAVHGRPDNLHDLLHAAALQNVCAKKFCTTCGSGPFIEMIRHYVGYNPNLNKEDMYKYGRLLDRREALRILDEMRTVHNIRRSNHEEIIRFVLMEVWMALGGEGCEGQMQERLGACYVGNILSGMIEHSNALKTRRQAIEEYNSPQAIIAWKEKKKGEREERLAQRAILKSEIDRKYWAEQNK